MVMIMSDMHMQIVEAVIATTSANE